MEKPLDDLAYFIEWGGRSWENQIHEALNAIGEDGILSGADLLDIGTRNGKMAVLFAMLGANVTGIDIVEETLDVARKEAEKWNISNINFMSYDRDLDVLPDNSFDIIFTKSTLVVVPELESFLEKISNKLRPNGRVVFLENGKGNAVFHALRGLKHWKKRWNYRRANYFTDEHIKLFRKTFDMDIVKKQLFPPIY